MHAVTRAELVPNAFTGPFGNAVRTTYYGAAAEVDGGPQAYLMQMRDADSEVAPHFHDVDQFQVVAEGDGRLGGTPLAPVTFHYADAFAPYGPITWTGPGLGWYTLRILAAGGYWLPEQRDKELARKGRNFTGHFKNYADPLGLRVAVTDRLSKQFEDGLGAWGIRLGPKARCFGPANDAGGQYLVICSGTMVQDGKDYPAGSIFLLQAGETAPMLQSGADGASVLVLQFPRATSRIGSSRESLKDVTPGHTIPGLAAPN